MLPPQTQSGKVVLDSLTSLSKELKFYADGFKATRQLKSKYAEIDQIRKGVSSATQSTKQLEKQFKSAEKTIKESKNLWDKFLGKIKGGGDKASKAASAGSSLGSFIAIGGVAVIVAIQSILQRQVNDYNFKSIDQLNKDLDKTNQIAVNARLGVLATNKVVEKIKYDIKTQELRSNGIEKQLVPIRQKANDALYEVRQGRKILEDRIAKLTPNTDAIQRQVNSTISNIRAEFQRQVDKIASDLRTQLQKPQTQPATKEDVQKLTADVQRITTTVNNIPTTIQRTFDATQSTIKQVVDRAIAPISRIGESWGVTVTPATITPATVTPSQGGGVTVTPATVTPVTVTPARFSSSAIGQQVQQTIKQEISATDSKINTLAGGLSTVGTAAQQAVTIANQAKIDANKRVLDPRIDDLYTRIREREKVDERVERKIDALIPDIKSMLPTIAGIPLIAGRVYDRLRPEIPTIPQIENATGTAMCRNLKTGCGKQAINDAVGNVINNSNNNTGSLLDKLNAGLNIADIAQQTAMLTTINNKLGDQLPGGIAGKLTRFSEWLKIDRVLNILTTAATVHNAFMLSNDIGQTLLGIIGNVLQVIGLKDDNGQAFDIGSIISSTVENFIKSIVGAENYQTITVVWAKANRIYQATTNVLNSFLSLSQVILQANELIAAYTGKIGNALKKGGVVLENAYGWMNPQPKFNRVTQFLENVQNAASTVQMVTQVPLDIVNASTELTNASTEFVKAIKEDDKPQNKVDAAPEPDQLKAQEILGKTNSQPSPFDFSDLFDGED